MALPKTIHRLTAAEYLEIERAAEFKSEFLDGEMFAMSGGSLSHSLIAANLIVEFRARLKGKPCITFTSDLRVKVDASGLYTYPDVSVACNGPKLEDDDTLLNPTVLVEVLSDSTEAYDRVKKWDLYRQLPTLQEYLLVNQYKPHIVQLMRQANDEWLLRDVIGLGASLTLPSLGISVALAEIYANVDFETTRVVERPEKS